MVHGGPLLVDESPELSVGGDLSTRGELHGVVSPGSLSLHHPPCEPEGNGGDIVVHGVGEVSQINRWVDEWISRVDLNETSAKRVCLGHTNHSTSPHVLYSHLA